jgi:hypothetical protein
MQLNLFTTLKMTYTIIFRAALAIFNAAFALVQIRACYARPQNFPMSSKSVQTCKSPIVSVSSQFRFGARISMSIPIIAAAFAFVTVVSSNPTVAEQALTGEVALQFLSGTDFQFECSRGVHGYGKFVQRSFLWAAYKFNSYSSSREEVLERRAEVFVRPNDNELCFKLKGLEYIGEMCMPVTEKTSGTYRLGSKNEWCELKVKQRTAGE